jgi:predicted nucleic acid-binding protein
VSIATDTNVLVRLLVRDDDEQYTAARRLVDRVETSTD